MHFCPEFQWHILLKEKKDKKKALHFYRIKHQLLTSKRVFTAASLNLALQNNKKYTFYYFNNLPFQNTLFSLSTLTIYFYYFIKILFFKDLFILSLTFMFLNIYIFLMVYFTNICLILTVIFFKIYNFFNGHIFYCAKSQQLQ